MKYIFTAVAICLASVKAQYLQEEPQYYRDIPRAILNSGHESSSVFGDIEAQKLILSDGEGQIVLDYQSVKQITDFINHINSVKQEEKKDPISSENKVDKNDISESVSTPIPQKCTDTDTCGDLCIGKWQRTCKTIRIGQCHKYNRNLFDASKMCCVCGGGQYDSI